MSEEIAKPGDTRTAAALSPTILRKVALRWLFFNTSAWNWERMQNLALAWSLLPGLKALYKNDADLHGALRRHMKFFNTEPTIGSPLIGAILAIETAKCNGESIDDDTFDAIKSGLMGPMAAIGDSLFGSTLNALLLSFAMGLALEGNIAGPLLFVFSLVILNLYIVIKGTSFGYKKGINIFDSDIFSQDKIERVTLFFQILGLTVIGSLSALFINLHTTISWGIASKVTQLQTILDSLMPGILSFALVLLLWYLHDKKGVSVLYLLGFTILVGFIGSIAGVI